MVGGVGVVEGGEPATGEGDGVGPLQVVGGRPRCK